jgi:NADPH:quinone reductase-like Zn-dependent oxidoreductase
VDGGVRYRHEGRLRLAATPTAAILTDDSTDKKDGSMRAVTIQTFGEPEGMVLTDLPEPDVAPGQLLIETEAIGVGGVDAVIRRGTIAGAAFGRGFVPGSEVAGRVIGVGDEVDPSWLGRRVWAFTGVGGAYAERAVAALDDVTALPDALSSIDAVTLGSAGPVAHFALAHGQFKAGESVLVRGAAGSIGILAVQLAAAGGAGRIAVTTSDADRGERLSSLGATHLLDRGGDPTGSPEAPNAASASTTNATATGASPSTASATGFDVVIDVVGGENIPGFIERLARNGRFVSVGVVGGYPPADFGMSLMRFFQRSLSFSTFSLDTVPTSERNRVRAEQFGLAASGALTAVVHDVLPLADAPDAHRRMDAGEVFGRIVLTT